MVLTARQRSIHTKNGAKRSASIKGKRPRKSSEGEYLVASAPSDLLGISYPGGAVTLGLLLAVRLIAAFWGQIYDCDETFNYWEPLHYLVYGSGLQTWEYSPVYAIRSYMPLWLFAVPAKVMTVVLSPVSIFYTIRAALAVLSACVELMFYKAVCHEFGVNVGRIWLFFTLPSAGMFAATPAFLPSAWSNILVTAAMACWWRKRYPVTIFLTAVNVLLSWPFTALLGVPIAIDILVLKKQYFTFIKWSIVSLVVIVMPTILVDTWHYGRLVIAPWNIVAYNIFTEHGPNLYGVTWWPYYVKNLFLNFNVVSTLALFCPFLLLGLSTVIAGNAASTRATSRASFCIPYWLELMPLYLWLGVFFCQAHKEERFLYPVYSLVVLCGAIALDCLQKMLYSIGQQFFRTRRDGGTKHYLANSGSAMVMLAYLLVAGFGGITRIASNYNNYQGLMTILQNLPANDEPAFLCYGKDWYTAPSSFFLPDNYELRFIKSEFKGQMPAPYSKEKNSTRLIHPYFNDLNKEDNRTYLKPSECHYIVDSDVIPETELQPHYHKQPQFEIVTSIPVLNKEKSQPILRAFYIPFLSSKYNVFANLYLLKNKMLS